MQPSLFSTMASPGTAWLTSKGNAFSNELRQLTPITASTTLFSISSMTCVNPSATMLSEPRRSAWSWSDGMVQSPHLWQSSPYSSNSPLHSPCLLRHFGNIRILRSYGMEATISTHSWLFISTISHEINSADRLFPLTYSSANVSNCLRDIGGHNAFLCTKAFKSLRNFIRSVNVEGTVCIRLF